MAYATAERTSELEVAGRDRPLTHWPLGTRQNQGGAGRKEGI